MSSQNIPCTNPQLCGVKTHRPGTQALCQQTKGANTKATQSAIASRNALEGGTELAKASKMWSDPSLNFAGKDHRSGTIMIDGGPIVEASRISGTVSLKYNGGQKTISEVDYFREKDFQLAVKQAYSDLARQHKKEPGQEDAWQSRRWQQERAMESLSANPMIEQVDARNLTRQAVSRSNSNSSNRGMTDVKILQNLGANPSVPSDALERIAEAPLAPEFFTADLTEIHAEENKAKLNVAGNPNANYETLKLLAVHKDNSIRKTAKDNMKARGWKPPGLFELIKSRMS